MLFLIQALRKFPFENNDQHLQNLCGFSMNVEASTCSISAIWKAGISQKTALIIFSLGDTIHRPNNAVEAFHQ
jgi:hypothetical protein